MLNVSQPHAWLRSGQIPVALTFDVDAESGWLGQGDHFAERLTTLSEARYGITRGLPRILALLADLGISATFYVPGLTAQLHPEVLPAILTGGHEIAHHGYRHRPSDGLSEQAQTDEIDRATEILQGVAGVLPSGYRSPSWEMTPVTFRLLCERGFIYDSSMMGDDRPYVEEHDGRSLLELPVHWSLDDWPFFAWSDYLGGGHLSSPRQWAEDWYQEYAAAVSDSRPITYTMHPEVVGRPGRMTKLRELLTRMAQDGHAAFLTHSDLTARYLAHHDPVQTAEENDT